MREENDFLIHRLSRNQKYYETQPAIRYSHPTRKWFVFSPKLISSILRDSNFQVPSYDRQILADRFGVPNEITRGINDTLPLSVEGKQHRERRERVALQIASRSRDAKLTFDNCFDHKLKRIRALGHNGEFCLVNDLFLEPIRATLLSLSGINFGRSPSQDVESLPQLFFDDAISLKKRTAQEIALFDTFEAIASPDEKTKKLEALGLLIVSINTLLGTLVGSVLAELSRQPQSSLAQIEWSEELSFTSLPYVERICRRATTFESERINEGEVVRLFLDVATTYRSPEDCEADLIFAVGMHRCLGIGFSKAIWQLVRKRLSNEWLIWTPKDPTYRHGDNVFNFFTEAEIVQNV